VMRVLHNDPQAPDDLREKALRLAGRMIEWSPGVRGGQGLDIARAILSSGRALARMQAIIAAQGATDFDYRQPQLGAHGFEVRAPRAGVVSNIDNLQLARIAGLAGAPKVASAGVDLSCKLGQAVAAGDVLYRVYAAYPADAAFARQASAAASGYTIGAPADVPRVVTEF
jgi:thymidine phosphorylase